MFRISEDYILLGKGRRNRRGKGLTGGGGKKDQFFLLFQEEESGGKSYGGVPGDSMMMPVLRQRLWKGTLLGCRGSKRHQVSGDRSKRTSVFLAIKRYHSRGETAQRERAIKSANSKEKKEESGVRRSLLRA